MYCGHGNHLLRSEVVTAMSIKIMVLWGVTPCYLMDGYCSFRGTCGDPYEGPLTALFRACFPLPPCPLPSFLLIPLPCFYTFYLLGISHTGLFRPKPPFPILWTVLPCLAHFCAEDEGNRFHWDIGTFFATASHPRRPQCQCSPLYEPQILYGYM
jgi:hypothetical protein